MFPAIWAWDRDYYQDNFARYVDGLAADEVSRRAAATIADGGTGAPPRTLDDYASRPPATPSAC